MHSYLNLKTYFLKKGYNSVNFKIRFPVLFLSPELVPVQNQCCAAQETSPMIFFFKSEIGTIATPNTLQAQHMDPLF